MAQLIQIGEEEDPAKRLRQEWAASLREHLKASDMSRKEFQGRLAEQGCSVSHQTISMWLRGETAPRPHHQAACAAALRVPARRLFPLGAVA